MPPASHQLKTNTVRDIPGDGTFEDVSESAGIQKAFGNGLGVIAADFNADAWPDIYVANDGNANQLWQNTRDGTFSDVALLAGAAYNANGEAEGGMGVTAGDVDGDGDEDLFVSHLNEETNTLYLNGGVGAFRDDTLQSGLGAASIGYTGFGSQWFDYDHDGWLDLFVVNGAVSDIESLRDTPYPFQQRNQLFRGVGAGGFDEVRGEAGSALELVEVSRGAAFGDVDNDGDIDVVVSNNNGPARLLLNEVGTAARSLSVRLEGVESNRDGIGARVALLRTGRDPMWRRVHRDGSYLSAMHECISDWATRVMMSSRGSVSSGQTGVASAGSGSTSTSTPGCARDPGDRGPPDPDDEARPAHLRNCGSNYMDLLPVEGEEVAKP